MRVLYGDGLVAVEAVPQEPAGEAVGGGAGGNGDAPQEGAKGAGAGAGGGAGGTGDTAKEAADGAPAKGGAEGARGGVANGAEGLRPCGIHAGDAPQVGALAWVGGSYCASNSGEGSESSCAMLASKSTLSRCAGRPPVEH